MHVNHVRIKGLPYFADICFLWLSRIRLVLSFSLAPALRGFALTCIFYIKFGVCARTVQDYFWIKGHERKKFNLDAFETVPRARPGGFLWPGKCVPFFMNLLSLVLVCAQQADPFALMELTQNYKQLNWHALFVQTFKAYLQRVPSSAD